MGDREGDTRPRQPSDLDESVDKSLERPTELDLSAIAAAAIEAARHAGVVMPAQVESSKQVALPGLPPVEFEDETHETPVPLIDDSHRLVAPVEHGTIVSPRPVSAPLPVQKRPASAYAPTAIHADLTTDTPPGVELAPFDELPEGTLLANRYHITHLVGQGGMGAVYAAHDDDLDEDIALKVLRSDLSKDAEFKRRIKGEVRLARRVSHPNVCRVHDFGVDDELVFVTMELVRGRTLRERLAENRVGRTEPFELAQIVDIIQQVGSALSAAHRAGVIHRDVKPDNVIVTEGRAVLTDFGVASLTTDSKRSVVGTPAYLAPEVLLGEAFDHRVDVYAVACMAYELIAGEPPFAARTLDLAMQVARNKPAYPNLPDAFATQAVRGALDRVLARGLAADPQLRTPTIDRFVDSFSHAARSAPLSTALRGRYGVEQMTPADPSTPIPLVRRTELRVTTALVWYSNKTAREMEEAERVVVDAGGVPIRVAAGEVIALFGASRSTGDDADRAAHAALALVSRYGGRAGLDTIRILLRPNDTALAGPDSAAAAATLAHDAPAGEVWASTATARQLAARFEITSGPGEARRVAAVRRGSRAKRRSAPIQNKRKTTLEIGINDLRANELATIDKHLERSFQERVPVFIEVRGMPGAGKTRLRRALIASVRGRREVDWMIATMTPVGEPAPLSVVASASQEWYEATTRIGKPAASIDHNAAARRWLEVRATRRPVILVVEDTQWADPTSRNLLDYLRASLGALPVAIITFSRADAHAPVPDGVELVYLGPLDDEKAARLARSIAPNAPPEAIEKIVKRAAGNPFFIEELARDVALSGTTGTNLPATIEAVVQAHLDQLPETAGQIAIAGAVIGPGFWRKAIARLVPGLNDTVLDAALADLERNGVIVQAAATIVQDDYYQFTSVLVRDVAYSRLPARERRQFHATIAGWLDEQARNSDQDAQRILAIAHHREQAGDGTRAATAYRQAGKRCLDLFAYGEAAAALRKAQSLTPVPDPTLDEELGDAVVQTEGYAAAEPIYQRALDESDDDDAPSRARLLYKLGAAAGKRGNTSNAIARFKAGLSIAAPGGRMTPWSQNDPRIVANLWANLGWTLGYQLGQVDEGHPYCERAVKVLEGTPHRRELANALSRLGGTYMRACRFADQLRCNQRNLELAIELRDLDMQLTAQVNLGVTYGIVGDLDKAVEVTLAARKLASKMAAAACDGLAASNLAGYYVDQGRYAEADKLLDEAIVIIERTGNRYVLCESFVFRARSAAARGDLVAARRHAEKSLALARSQANQLDAAVALRILAQLDARADLREVALRRIDEALTLAASNDKFEAIRTRAARARILARLGEPADAELDELAEEFARLGTKRELTALRNLDEVR